MQKVLTIFFIMISFSLSAQEWITFEKREQNSEVTTLIIEVNTDGFYQFTDDSGQKFTRQLTTREVKKLQKRIKKVNAIETNPEDKTIEGHLPTTLLIAYDHEPFAIQYAKVPSRKIRKLERSLMKLSPEVQNNPGQWVNIPAPKTKPSAQSDMGRKEVDQRTIILQLQPKINFEEWSKKYDKYGLALNKKLVPNRPLYLVRYDPKTIAFDQLIDILKKDTAVVEAEENHKVQMR